MTVPTSTYRLQIRSSLTLFDAAELAGYLNDLGVGAVYVSPLLQATAGSDHGYDTSDVTRIDPARGGEAGMAALLEAAEQADLGVVVDIVPNHLGIAAPAENPAWWDVLQHSQDSPYAGWFDIDWTAGRILVPVLGDDPVLGVENDELRYFEHRFPLAPGSYAPGDELEDVQARQHYELVHFSRGNTELNYRRFFAVTTLAGVRVEDPDVFAATHERVRDWVAQGITGLRIDHPDGLVDPRGYLERLRTIAPTQWLTVEKILEPGEQLPRSWPVHGTTGYDAMCEVDGIFIDPSQRERFTELYQRLTGDLRTLADHIEAGKRMVTAELLPAEVSRMAALVPEVDHAGPALAEVAVAFEVYRSYLPEGVEHLDDALATAAERNPSLAPTLAALSPRLHDAHDELAVRLQQLSGATMAKGVEDTAYYRYARFIALNEVGGNPDQFGLSLDDFHQAQTIREENQPESMTAGSTHDTKRGEDVRARLAVLAEIGDEWEEFAKLFLGRTDIPNVSFGYFVAQTLVGTGPIERPRMHAYVEKAMREASDGTTWTDPSPTFEASVHAAVDLAYDDAGLRPAWDRLDERVREPGWSNALGKKLVQLMMPGVPDVYQGTELLENTLVDPDNRRHVDFAALRALLSQLTRDSSTAQSLDDSGAAKLWVTHKALQLRRAAHLEGYVPLRARGPAADHCLAFRRDNTVTVATRLPVTLGRSGGWRDTTLDIGAEAEDVLRTGAWHGGEVSVASLLPALPVALLQRAPGGTAATRQRGVARGGMGPVG